MSIGRVLLVLAPLAACATDARSTEPTSLADLPIVRNRVDLHLLATTDAGGQSVFAKLTVTEDQEMPCVELDPQLTATFGGRPMRITRGYVQSTGACAGPLFDLDPTAGPLGDGPLVIEDASATWTVAAPDLFTNDFMLDPQDPTRVTWPSSFSVDEAMLQYGGAPDWVPALATSPEIVGSAQPSAVKAHTTWSTTTCEGPSSCVAERWGYATL